MKPLPPKPPIIDGVTQEPTKEGPYNPRGVLSHEYFPLELVAITEIGNDLNYMASYWQVTKIWKLFIPKLEVYERLRDKLLQGRTVVVDYSDMLNLGIYIPKNKQIDGLNELFKSTVMDLRELDRENLDRHLSEMRHKSAQDVLAEGFERIG